MPGPSGTTSRSCRQRTTCAASGTKNGDRIIDRARGASACGLQATGVPIGALPLLVAYSQSALGGRAAPCRFGVVGPLARGVGRRPGRLWPGTLATFLENTLLKGLDRVIFLRHRFPPVWSSRSRLRLHAAPVQRRGEALRTRAYPTHCQKLRHHSRGARDSVPSPNIAESSLCKPAHVGGPEGRSTLIPCCALGRSTRPRHRSAGSPKAVLSSGTRVYDSLRLP